MGTKYRVAYKSGIYLLLLFFVIISKPCFGVYTDRTMIEQAFACSALVPLFCAPLFHYLMLVSDFLLRIRFCAKILLVAKFNSNFEMPVSDSTAYICGYISVDF